MIEHYILWNKLTKLKKYNGVQIFLDDINGLFYFKIADIEFSETTMQIAKARIDEQLQQLKPINKKCIFFDGFSSTKIREAIIVRKDKNYGYDEEGRQFGLDNLYEYTEENINKSKKCVIENEKGWDILHNSEIRKKHDQRKI